MAYHCVTKPKLFDMTHAHDFQEVLCFIGGNPLDITDFGAEVEIQLGAEHEKHTITKTSCVSIPPNLPHCPLNIKRVDKPIIFLEISNAPKYEQAPAKLDAKP
jgi:mannose-6-phosphate isomerase-like protein (cupin superfamily)